jgi:hypothetical protein
MIKMKGDLVMKRKSFTITLMALLALLLSVGGVTGQGPEPEGEVRPEEDISAAAKVGSLISYQGRLTEGGSPVTGLRDMVFRLYSNSSCSTQVWDVVRNDVLVEDGLFSVKLDVNQDHFNGQGLWLRVVVGGTTAVSCEEILPVPYALSLRPGAEIADTNTEVKLNLYTYTVIPPFSLTSKYGIRSQVSGSYNYGYGVYGYSSAGNLGSYGVYGQSDSTSGRGVYGHATASSGTTYGVYGRSDSASGAGVYAQGIGSGPDLILSGDDTTGGGRIYSDPAYSSSDIVLVSNDAVRIDLDNDGDEADADFEIRNKDDTLIFNVDESGRTSIRGNLVIQRSSSGVTIIELGEGLDYAEGFDVSDETGIAPGAVLVIDPDHPGELRMSDTAYDRKVAGIVAGAQGMGSAVRLAPGQFDYDVALAGRVYCNVDATETGVEPGDLLTTSATPGYAMKVTDYARAQGAILGKAMERLGKGEKGQILVLVTLQ